MADGESSNVELIRAEMSEAMEIPPADELIAGVCIADVIELVGAGEYKRGDVLMSNAAGEFVKATGAGLATAKEVCILSENITLEDGQTARTAGYFSGVFKGVELPDGVALSDLRKHKIFVR